MKKRIKTLWKSFKHWLIYIGDNWFVLLLILSGFVFPILLYKFDFFPISTASTIDTNKASQIGGYLAGTTGVLWGLAGIIFVYKAFIGSQVQQAENNFFGMMNTLNDIINNTEGVIEIDERIGKLQEHLGFPKVRGLEFYNSFAAYFKYLTNTPDIQNEYRNETSKEPMILDKEDAKNDYATVEFSVWCYNKAFSEFVPQLGHFFRFLYNIIKYVDQNSILKQRQKEQLLNLIQAQLNNKILGLIFYNGLTKVGENFKEKYLEEYPFLLENIDYSSIIHDSHIAMYENTTFKHI